MTRFPDHKGKIRELSDMDQETRWERDQADVGIPGF